MGFAKARCTFLTYTLPSLNHFFQKCAHLSSGMLTFLFGFLPPSGLVFFSWVSLRRGALFCHILFLLSTTFSKNAHTSQAECSLFLLVLFSLPAGLVCFRGFRLGVLHFCQSMGTLTITVENLIQALLLFVCVPANSSLSSDSLPASRGWCSTAL